MDIQLLNQKSAAFNIITMIIDHLFPYFYITFRILYRITLIIPYRVIYPTLASIMFKHSLKRCTESPVHGLLDELMEVQPTFNKTTLFSTILQQLLKVIFDSSQAHFTVM